MAWQEFVILAGSLLANVSLIPTIRDASARVPFRTSAGTASILIVQTAMFLSLGLVTTAIGTAIGTASWVLILLLRSEWWGARRVRESTTATTDTSGGTIASVPADD